MTENEWKKIVAFMKFVKSQGVEREESEPFMHIRIADSWDDLPEFIQNLEPPWAYGAFVDDRGDHIRNQRLPGGYHLTSGDNGDQGVYLHFDAYDPLLGPGYNAMHYFMEVNEVPSLFFNQSRENYFSGGSRKVAPYQIDENGDLA